MALDKNFLKSFVVFVLDQMDMYSDSAKNLILGTIAQESAFGTYWTQLGNGPAKGIIQMEPYTENDIWENYLKYKPQYRDIINRAVGLTGPNRYRLEHNLVYQIMMCRLHYRRVKEALPKSDDVRGLAEYWKKYYNSSSSDKLRTSIFLFWSIDIFLSR